VVSTPLENMKVSWDYEIPNIWKVIKFHGSKPPTSSKTQHWRHFTRVPSSSSGARRSQLGGAKPSWAKKAQDSTVKTSNSHHLRASSHKSEKKKHKKNHGKNMVIS